MTKKYQKNNKIEVPGLKYLMVWELHTRHGLCTHIVTGPAEFFSGEGSSTGSDGTEEAKRSRPGFRSLEEAIDWAKKKEGEVLAVGLGLAAMPPEMRVDAFGANAILKKAGIDLSLTDLARRIAADEEAKRSRCKMPLDQYLDEIEPELRKGKSRSKRRPPKVVTWNNYRRMMDRLLAIAGPETPISELNVANILRKIDYLDGKAYNDMVSFWHYVFSFAVDARKLPENPFYEARKDKKPVPEVKKDIFSPQETRAFLWAAWEFCPELIPYFAVAFFGFLRAAGESLLTKWEHFFLDDAEMVVPEFNSKIHQERWIDICDCLRDWLRAWLSYYPNPSGTILPECHKYHTLEHRRTILALIIGLDEWKRNGPRKSCASYAKRLNGSDSETSQKMGNSPEVLRSNYLRGSRRRTAQAYFSIKPPLYPPGQGRTYLISEFRRMARSDDSTTPLKSNDDEQN